GGGAATQPVPILEAALGGDAGASEEGSPAGGEEEEPDGVGTEGGGAVVGGEWEDGVGALGGGGRVGAGPPGGGATVCAKEVETMRTRNRERIVMVEAIFIFL
ncbi:glycine-rich protein DOT1-like, partial [Phalaenopsis equestris]|uniref:glycine-rich protein DOT1-like n=1 Tax=Phalaenopsis equestris TaxID=78828 RepID=UPI0009E2DF6A